METKKEMKMDEHSDANPTDAQCHGGKAGKRAGPERRAEFPSSGDEALQPVNRRQRREPDAAQPHGGAAAARTSFDQVFDGERLVRPALRQAEPRHDSRE